jgi:hypothetical protein
MADFSKCVGRTIDHKLVVVCIECKRRTALSTPFLQSWIEPEARRKGANTWICEMRLPEVTA